MNDNKIPTLKELLEMSKMQNPQGIIQVEPVFSDEDLLKQISSLMENNRQAIFLATVYVNSCPEYSQLKEDVRNAIIFDYKALIINYRSYMANSVTDDRLFQAYQQYINELNKLESEGEK